MAVTWPKWIQSSEHVAEAVDWVRWKTEGRAKMVLAVGANSIAVAKNREVNYRRLKATASRGTHETASSTLSPKSPFRALERIS